MTTNPSTTPTESSASSAASTAPPSDTASATTTATASSGPGSSTPTESSAPAETSPPTVPLGLTDGDRNLLLFAQQIELAAAELYGSAFDASGDDPLVVTLSTFMKNHTANANLMAAQLGRAGSHTPAQEVVDQFSGSFGTNGDTAPEDVAAAAYELESTLVATYQEMAGQLGSVDALTPIASIMLTESRQCAVLADASGQGDDVAALLDNTATPLTLPAEG